MNASDSQSASPQAPSRARNERVVEELREVVGRSRPNTYRGNPSLMIVPSAETPFEIDGQEHPARLFNLSARGGSLATDHKPAVGSLIRIGRITARVVAHFDDGIAFDFEDIEA